MGTAKVIPLRPSDQVPTEEPSASKPPRQTLHALEVKPQPHWLIQVPDARGKKVWYLRLEITGLLPRRYGPFVSKRRALLFLHTCLNEFILWDLTEFMNMADSWGLTDTYHPEQCTIIEDQLGSAYRKASPTKKDE